MPRSRPLCQKCWKPAVQWSVPVVPNELFAENSWIQVMLGQGILPASHHQTADLMGDEELAHFLGNISGTIDRTVAQLPSHQKYVEQYCSGTGW